MAYNVLRCAVKKLLTHSLTHPVLAPFLFAVYLDNWCEMCVFDRSRFSIVYAEGHPQADALDARVSTVETKPR